MKNKDKITEGAAALEIACFHFKEGVEYFERILGGNINQVYSFTHQDVSYILRLNERENALARAQTISDLLFQGEALFSKVLFSGNKNGFSYSISEKIPGVPVSKIEKNEGLTQSIITQTAKFHKTPIDGTTGFGFVDDEGNGSYPDWESFVDAFFSENGIGSFWQGWHELFETTCLERDVFTEMFKRLKKYSRFNAPHRRLVHGDLHGSNILSSQNEVTGFIDFDNMMYGDFIIDLATIDRVVPIEKFEMAYKKTNFPIPFFKERYLGAKYFKGLDILRFYAKTGNEAGYKSLKAYLLGLPE